MNKREAIPGFFTKRELLYTDQPNHPRLKAEGGTCLDAGLFDAALELFQKAGDASGIERALDAARREGDVFSFEAALKALGRTATSEEWARLGETAAAAGKLWFAYRAFEKADNQGGLDRLRKEMVDGGFKRPEER